MKQVLLFIVFLLFSLEGFGQCPNSQIILTSQSEVNDFAVSYPRCKAVLGDVTISGDSIVDLTPLSKISSISGSLIIEDNLLLSNLAGLGTIVFTKSNKQLIIRNNPQLKSVKGLRGVSLDRLDVISLDLEISNNPLLLHLDGLETITSARGIFIKNNNSLTNIDGLTGITSVLYSSDIWIENNKMLEQLTGLSNMKGELSSLFIVNNPSLVSLEGLEGITSFGIEMFIFKNDSITSLKGLQNIKYFENQLFLTITGNNRLTDISVLENYTLSPFDIVTISQNPLLSICNYSSICKNMTIGDEYFINDNAPGCETALEVAQSCGVCSLDSIEFTTQKEIDAFADVYGDCSLFTGDLVISGADITSLLGLSQIKSIVGSLRIEKNPLLTSLKGLENLEIKKNDFSYDIIIQGNQALEDLDGLAGVIYDSGTLTIYDNYSLKSISGLSTITGSFDLTFSNNSNLLNLNGLEGVTELESLNLEGNECLENILGLHNVTGGVSSFKVAQNTSLYDFKGFEGVVSIGKELVISGNHSLTSLEGLESISNENVEDESVSISIIDNGILSNISALENCSPTTIFLLEITDNPLLSKCNILSFCNFISSNGVTIISDNKSDCNSENEVLGACNEALNFITGNINFNVNKDDCTKEDFDLSSVLVETRYGSSTVSTLTNQDGDYSLFVPSDGIATTTLPQESLPENFVSSPSNFETAFVGSGNTELLDFCVTAPNPSNNLKVTLFPLGAARPGFNSKYLIVYENIGSTILDGTVAFTFDNERQDFVRATSVVGSQNDGVVTFDYEPILPFSQRSIEIEMHNFESPTNNSGDQLDFLVNVYPFDNDFNIRNNTDSLKQLMVNSFDTNYKQIVHASEIFEEQAGDFLNYLIRFQNTGTTNTINVRVEDVLSDHLNWDTFRTLSSSHEYRVEITNGNQVAFIFNDIHLSPKEQDEQGSSGYVAFQIRTNSDLQLDHSISNTASIFFDFNKPVITNTVTTTVIKPLDVQEQLLTKNTRLYINPISEILHVKTGDVLDYKFSILYNMMGEQLLYTPTKRIDFSNISEGIYFTAVETEQGILTKKIIVE